MLLNQAINAQQNTYAQIQVQIEALQEQQRQIQAYLQRLGSIESKMESAAQLMQEAIADIRETCPDELPVYQELITGFFGNAPVAFLKATVESVEESTDDTPQEVAEDSITPDVEVIATEEQDNQHPEAEVSQDDAITVDAKAEAVEPASQHVIIKGVETTVILPDSVQIDSMTKYMVCKWLGDLNIEFKRSQPVAELRLEPASCLMTPKNTHE